MCVYLDLIIATGYVLLIFFSFLERSIRCDYFFVSLLQAFEAI